MSKISRQDIKECEKGILYELEGHQVLIISFGGIYQGLGIPVFEFLKTLNSFDCDQIFIRDFKQVWYHRGADDHDSLLSLAEHLQNQISSGRYKKVVCMGNSMGGFAAMIFGAILNVDQVIAFSPQTFLDRKNRWRHLDFRWRVQVKNLHALRLKLDTYLDLKTFFSNLGTLPKTNIYYSEQGRLDKLHAERMSSFSNIHLIPKKGGHQLVKKLKENDELSVIMKHAIG